MRNAGRPGRLFTSQIKRLFSGQAAAQVGDGLVQTGFAQLIIFEISRGSTPAAIAQVLAATLLPYSFLGPVAGVVIDRFDRRKVLGTSAVARSVVAALGVGAWALGSAPVAVTLVLALTSIGRFLLAAKSAVIPRALGLAGDDLVESAAAERVPNGSGRDLPPLLARANAFSSALGVVSVFAGAVGGIALTLVSTPLAFAAGAGAYALASLLFFSLEDMPPAGSEAWGGRGAIATALNGLREELRRASRADVGGPLGAIAWHRTALGAGIVVVVLVADSRYGLELPGYTGALAIAGVAALAGSALAPVVLGKWRFSAVLALSFASAAAATSVAAFDLRIASLVVAVSGASLAFQVLKVGVDSVLQQRAPDLVRGRVFSLQDAAYNASFVLGAVLVVPLWGRVDPSALLWGTAVVFGVGALLLPTLGRRSATRGVLVAVLFSAAAVLAFPSPSLWPLAFFCLAPAIYQASTAPSYRRAALIGWLAGAAFFLSTGYWLAHKTLFFQPVIAAIFGLTWIPWSLAARATLGNRRPIQGLLLVPSVWVLSEYLRAWHGLGGPWALLGASQWSTPWGLEAASWGGVWLVSWVLVASAALLVAWKLVWPLRRTGVGESLSASRAPPLLASVVVVAVVVAAWAGRLARETPPPQATLRMAAVQPGVIDPADERFAAGEALTERLGRGYDLVVWGESSLGEDPFLRPEYMARIESLSRGAGAPLLVNVDARTAVGSIFKAAVLVEPEGPIARYDKRRLVPFGEYVPLRPVLGWVTKFTDAPDEDRGRGWEDVIMQVPGTDLSIAPLICFESAFPDMARSVAREGADVIVVQSANTTFQESWLPEQHASLAAVRAAEAGKPVVHVTLSGTSAAFDADGRKLAWVGTDYVGPWTVDIPVFGRDTLYRRLGDWVVWASAASVVLACAGRLARRRRAESASERLGDEAG